MYVDYWTIDIGTSIFVHQMSLRALGLYRSGLFVFVRVDRVFLSISAVGTHLLFIELVV